MQRRDVIPFLRRHERQIFTTWIASGMAGALPNHGLWLPTQLIAAAVFFPSFLAVVVLWIADGLAWVRTNGIAKAAWKVAVVVIGVGPIAWLWQAGWWWPKAIAVWLLWTLAVSVIAASCEVAYGMAREVIRERRAARS